MNKHCSFIGGDASPEDDELYMTSGIYLLEMVVIVEIIQRVEFVVCAPNKKMYYQSKEYRIPESL